GRQQNGRPAVGTRAGIGRRRCRGGAIQGFVHQKIVRLFNSFVQPYKPLDQRLDGLAQTVASVPIMAFMKPAPTATAFIRLYQDWLREQRGLSFDGYHALWRWSVTELDAFWQSIWDYFELRSPTPHTAVLGRNAMPGAQWFP